MYFVYKKTTIFLVLKKAKLSKILNLLQIVTRVQMDGALQKLIYLICISQFNSFFHLCIYNLDIFDVYAMENPVHFTFLVFTYIYRLSGFFLYFLLHFENGLSFKYMLVFNFKTVKQYFFLCRILFSQRTFFNIENFLVKNFLDLKLNFWSQ